MVYGRSRSAIRQYDLFKLGVMLILSTYILTNVTLMMRQQAHVVAQPAPDIVQPAYRVEIPPEAQAAFVQGNLYATTPVIAQLNQLPVATTVEQKFLLRPLASKSADLLPQLAEETAFTEFVTLLNATNLAKNVNSDVHQTIFVPTNAAFEALPQGTVQRWLENPDQLETILATHWVRGGLSTDALTNRTALTTATDETFPITLTENGLKISHSHVLSSNITIGNTTIHAIDRVLLTTADIIPPVIDSSGVDAFEGAVLTVVGSAEPHTTLLLELNGTTFSHTTVATDGTWRIARTITPNRYELIAYTLQDGFLIAQSAPVTLNVSQ